MRAKRLLIAAPLAAVAFGGCSLSGPTHQSSQAGSTDYSAGNVSQMPSGFRNFADKCVNVQGEWYAVFSASSSGGGALAVAPDPKCTHEGR